MAPFVLQTFVLSGIGEEMGWRGYLQKILQKKYNSILTSIFIGAIVATWHLPLFFQEGDIHAQNSFIYFLRCLINY
jgi:membrane protease YdiL (CAAX protease family)